MRYTQGEKLEIIRLVEGSDLPVKTTLRQLQVSRASFYRWYRIYVDHGAEGLAAIPSSRRQFWNRIPDDERERVVEVALAKPDLSARDLAFYITDNEGYFISESSVYRILRADDLVTSPAYIVISAADECTNCGRPILRTLRSSAGAGTTCRRCWTTSAGTSSAGVCGLR